MAWVLGVELFIIVAAITLYFGFLPSGFFQSAKIENYILVMISWALIAISSAFIVSKFPIIFWIFNIVASSCAGAIAYNIMGEFDGREVWVGLIFLGVFLVHWMSYRDLTAEQITHVK